MCHLNVHFGGHVCPRACLVSLTLSQTNGFRLATPNTLGVNFSLICVGPLRLVIGEENNPTAAHQSRKSRQIWVPRA